MKKFFCAVLALMFLACAALADTSLITGEVVEIPTPGDVRLLISDQAFEASFNDRQMFGALQPDGTLLIGTQEKAVRLGGLPDESLLQGLFDRLDQQPTYQNSIYSSLFTQAQKIELPADEVRDYALTLISLFPLLDRDGSLRQALGDAAGSEPWASVTRYRADPSQYPKTWMMDVNVFSPALPALRVQYRQDEFGSNFEIACTRNAVTDWDETVLAIEDDLSGESGKVLRGFTMVDDTGDETWTYLEITGFGFGYQWRFATDIYRDDADPQRWEATAVMNNDTDNVPVMTTKLSSVSVSQQPSPIFDGAVIVDATDGLDDAERELLGLT